VPREERCHHVFGNRLLVAEAIAHDGRSGQGIEIDAIVPSARHVKQAKRRRGGQAAMEPGADDCLGPGIRISLLAGRQNIGQHTDIMVLADQVVELVAEGRGVLAVEHDFHAG